MFNEELPKLLTSAADNAKKFQEALDDLSKLIGKLQGDFSSVEQQLGQLHKQLIAANPSDFESSPDPVVNAPAPKVAPPLAPPPKPDPLPEPPAPEPFKVEEKK